MRDIIALCGFSVCVAGMLSFPILAAHAAKREAERERIRERLDLASPWGEVVDWRRVTQQSEGGFSEHKTWSPIR